jgi:hypothetical protein
MLTLNWRKKIIVITSFEWSRFLRTVLDSIPSMWRPQTGICERIGECSVAQKQCILSRACEESITFLANANLHFGVPVN